MQVHEFIFLRPEDFETEKIITSKTKEFGKITCIPINLMNFYDTPKNKILIEDYIEDNFNYKNTYWKFEANKYTIYYGMSEDEIFLIGLFDLVKNEPLNSFILSTTGRDNEDLKKFKKLHEFFKNIHHKISFELPEICVKNVV
jgi:hypothetical protein